MNIFNPLKGTWLRFALLPALSCRLDTYTSLPVFICTGIIKQELTAGLRYVVTHTHTHARTHARTHVHTHARTCAESRSFKEGSQTVVEVISPGPLQVSAGGLKKAPCFATVPIHTMNHIFKFWYSRLDHKTVDFPSFHPVLLATPLPSRHCICSARIPGSIDPR